MLNLKRHLRALDEKLAGIDPRDANEGPERLPGYETGEDFLPWLERVSPPPKWHWRWRHLRAVQDKLGAVTRGEIRKLMIFMPPRHGKSECATVHYSAYRIERDPATRVIIGSYHQTLADKFSRKTRRLVGARTRLSTDRKAVADWETKQGGGLRSVGVGGGITGHGGDLIIIDDPVKNREEAESQTFRDRAWDWYTDDIYTRLEPAGAIILQMTRWHQDDLAGRILASEDGPNWTVLSLPALAEENDPLGRGCVTCPGCNGSGERVTDPTLPCIVCEGQRMVGEALCPERFPEVTLGENKRTLGRSFYALYQQSPRPRDGAMFKWDWFAKVAERPIGAKRIRYWDTAGSEGRGDYTVGVLMSRTAEGVFYIEDVVRGQWSPARKDQEIRAAAERDMAMSSGGGYTIWLEKEAGIGGEERTMATTRALRGFAVHSERVSGSKEVRAEPLAAQAEVGNVKILVAPWNRDFLEELCSFPHGRHDDQVDAAAGALNKLAARRVASVFGFRI